MATLREDLLRFFGSIDHDMISDEAAVDAVMRAVGYVPTPVDDETAKSLIGEGVHTGLRKGTDAWNSGNTWRAIAAPESGWSDAIHFAVEGLKGMGYRLCKVEKDKP